MVEDVINNAINDIFNVLFAGRCYSLDSKQWHIRISDKKIRIHKYVFKRYCFVVQLKQRSVNYALTYTKIRIREF